jgi:hypothetical protein
MEQVIAKLQHEMRSHHSNQPNVTSKKAAKAAYVKNFHEDRWSLSGQALDDMAQKLTRWILENL